MSDNLKPLNEDMDARRWANEFNSVLVSKGEQPYDPGWLISWFANALMCGSDVKRWEMEKELTSLRARADRLINIIKLDKRIEEFECGHDAEHGCKCGIIQGEMISKYRKERDEFLSEYEAGEKK